MDVGVVSILYFQILNEVMMKDIKMNQIMMIVIIMMMTVAMMGCSCSASPAVREDAALNDVGAARADVGAVALRVDGANLRGFLGHHPVGVLADFPFLESVVIEEHGHDRADARTSALPRRPREAPGLGFGADHRRELELVRRAVGGCDGGRR